MIDNALAAGGHHGGQGSASPTSRPTAPIYQGHHAARRRRGPRGPAARRDHAFLIDRKFFWAPGTRPPGQILGFIGLVNGAKDRLGHRPADRSRLPGSRRSSWARVRPAHQGSDRRTCQRRRYRGGDRGGHSSRRLATPWSAPTAFPRKTTAVRAPARRRAARGRGGHWPRSPPATRRDGVSVMADATTSTS